MTVSGNPWLRPIALVLCLAGIAIYLKLSGSRGSGSQDAPTRNANSRKQTSATAPSLGRPLESAEPQSIATRLAPGLEIIEGVVEGGEITGPVKVTGHQPPSKMTSAPAPAGGKGAAFSIEATDDATLEGNFTIEAASARATPNGVRFTGPVRLLYQGDVGQWYALSSMSEESYFFVSENGLKKLFADPTGAVQFGTPVESDPAPQGSQE